MREEVLGRLVALRKKSKLSAKDVSIRLDKNEYYISKMENGVFFPSFQELEKLLAVYNSCLEELFYDEFEKFHFEKQVVEKLRTIGKKEKDIILGVLALAFEIKIKGERNEN